MHYRKVVFRFIEKLCVLNSTSATTRLNLLREAWLEVAAMERSSNPLYNDEYELVYTDLLKYAFSNRADGSYSLGRLQAFDFVINPSINDKGLPNSELLLMIEGYHHKKKMF